MSVSSSRLSDAIQDALWLKIDPGDPAKKPVKTELRDLSDSVAASVLTELIDYMEVNGVDTTIGDVTTSVAVASVSAVTVGAGVSGPGTGTGTGSATGQQSNDGTGHLA